MPNQIYTGIGSRETPDNILTIMDQLGYLLGQHGWTLRSGRARGADQAFEYGAIRAQGKMEIYLPWPGFENAPNNTSYKAVYSEEAAEVAAKFHPAWNRCSPPAKKMHTRNVFQVAGQDLNSPTDLVICWTKDGKRGGGTGQALRIAEYLKIPIFDLAICEPNEIIQFINQKYGDV